ncbi:DUF4838 domain-containing protein [Flavobacterium sandaracinum]|uniref:DUF4838 domain-containing protein n=1 Tax=Flavobacterium sandaracinum TaxID=2541733 RepID=A0A4R5D176_9FLAO|nr:DUF4838 domain-containing protein [Flavobacterium sandaracinum]TDE06972.1 DUF4838 domain-containing protein [Flavobacterium sandaracinum]
MAQSEIIIDNNSEVVNTIQFFNDNAKPAAIILKKYLDKSFSNPFVIQSYADHSAKKIAQIHLEVTNSKNIKDENSFSIKSDNNTIFLAATNEKLLRYAVYTLLENWGFRKFTATDLYIPKLKRIVFPKNTTQLHTPSFEYRVILYPDAFDEDFRDWHKLDWHLDDFSTWGHSFHTILPPKEYFKTNPEFFALYEGIRRPESICMTNETAVKNVIKKINQIILDNPKASFISVSQNDDAVYCECSKCKSLNENHGGPQGSLYFFMNKIAKHFPKTKIVTLAYQHTYKAPINLKIEPNIYTLFCPIELNRGKSIVKDPTSKSFVKIMQDWSKTASHLYLWDYTVQFSNYLSPFPNIHTFSDNYKLFKKNNVKGLFAQGYADVPGDFSELRQYLLAKLLWNTELDIEANTDDFLRGFYGNAATSIKEYLNLLSTNQENSNRALEIYSGPIQSRNTFLTPEAMDRYDQLLDEASMAVNEDPILYSRIKKLRLTLEYAFFEQSKFYGKEQHGMFNVNENGDKEVKPRLNERVSNFAEACNEFGIYELSEEGLTPDQYYKNWLEITKNTATHIGENLAVNLLTPPSTEYSGKGSAGLVDGINGHRDYNINWIGWYGNDPEIEIITNNLDFNQIKIHFLDNQRNWIFLPQKITLLGYKNKQWNLITEKKLVALADISEVQSNEITITDDSFRRFEKIKLIIQNQENLPSWRKRKNKKPMVMIDEIELYNK